MEEVGRAGHAGLEEEENSSWACRFCTLENVLSAERCAACTSRRPRQAALAASNSIPSKIPPRPAGCVESSSRKSLTRERSHLPEILGPRSVAPLPERIKKFKVIVIGAGAAGLTAAQRLLQTSMFDVEILEGRERTGGRIDTRNIWRDSHSRQVKSVSSTPSPSSSSLSQASQQEGQERQEGTPSGGAVVDFGAAFIHGCDPDGENLIYNTLLKRGVPMQTKSEGIEMWFAPEEYSGTTPSNTILQPPAVPLSPPLNAVPLPQRILANWRAFSPKEVLRLHHSTYANFESARPQLHHLKRKLAKLQDGPDESYLSQLVLTKTGYDELTRTPAPAAAAHKFLVPPQQIDRLRKLYTQIDELMLKKAVSLHSKSSTGGTVDDNRTESANGLGNCRDEVFENCFEVTLQEVKKSEAMRGEPLSKLDEEVLNGLRTSQHAYVAEASKLSLQDMATTHDNGVMSGDNKTMEGGYRAFIDTISQGLKDFVKLNQEVKSISYSKGVGVRVETKAGHVASADFALVTVSLGVLKHGGLQFQPPLPADKQTAIQNLGMGLENKVIFMFEEKDVFWPQQTHYFRLASEPFIKVLNLHALGARGVIVMHAAPPLAQELDGNSKKGEAKFMSVLDVIRRGTAGHLPSTPRPIYSHTTGWLQDPFARGSYSFAPHHVHHHRLQQALAKPLHGLFFAGEALDRLDSQTVHGAVSSACAAANRIREAALALALPAVPSSPSSPSLPSLPSSLASLQAPSSAPSEKQGGQGGSSQDSSSLLEVENSPPIKFPKSPPTPQVQGHSTHIAGKKPSAKSRATRSKAGYVGKAGKGGGSREARRSDQAQRNAKAGFKVFTNPDWVIENLPEEPKESAVIKASSGKRRKVYKLAWFNSNHEPPSPP